MKHFLIIVLAMYLMISCDTPQEGFILEGTINDYPEGTAILKRRVSSDFVTLDSVNFKDGTFTLKGNLESPEMCYLWISDTLSNMRFFVENSKISLSVKVDSLRNPNISGSASNELLDGYNLKMKPFDEEMNSTYKEYLAADKKGDKEKAKELETKFDDISDAQKKESLQFIKDNSNSAVSAYLTWGTLIYDLSIPEMDEILNNLSPDLGNSIYVTQIQNHVAVLKTVDIGQPMVDIVMVDTLGNIRKLSELKGKLVLIDFWASWCGPCRRENPNVVALYNEYKDKNFEIFGVSFDKSDDKWRKAIQDDELTWVHVSDLKGWDSAAGKLYGVRSIPHTVLINEEGIIIEKNLRGDALREKVAELLEG